jgi:hypothetical protein
MARPEFFKRYNLKPRISSIVKYAVAQPLTALDRAPLPLLTGFQILRETYASSTHVATRLGWQGRRGHRPAANPLDQFA